jgi:argininosuccinate synthase
LVRPQAEPYTTWTFRLAELILNGFALVTMDPDPTKAYNQDDATGFIRLNALRLKVAAKVRTKEGE